MKYKFGKKSLERLSQCDLKLQALCNRMLERSDFDLTITCGYRGREEQEKAYCEGKSCARFGQSKHNYMPSKAVDICPYPIDWNDDIRWWKMVALAYDCAAELGIKIKSGAFFTGLCDCPHIELKD